MRISFLHPRYGGHLRKLFNLPLTEDRHIPGSGEGFLAIKHNFTFTVTYLKFLGFFT